MRRLLIVVFLIILGAAHTIALDHAGRELRYAQENDDLSTPLPAPLLKILSLDHDGLTSDFLFLRSLVFIGTRLEKNVQLDLPDREWRWFYATLDVVTDIDPYFKDPYYLGNAFLTWHAGMANEANTLLKKGSRSRDWDWVPPFFIGFNYFYFLQENDKAAEYLMEASRRPGASPTLASLASRLAFKANKTENSILFLQEMIKKTDDEPMKKLFETRLEVFKAIRFLEKAAETYRGKFRGAPSSIDDLIGRNIIEVLPKDPYGGKFFIDGQGNVRTTSEKLLMPYLKKK